MENLENLTEKQINKIAEDYVKPFRHKLHLGEEQGLINDLVSFAIYLKNLTPTSNER